MPTPRPHQLSGAEFLAEPMTGGFVSPTNPNRLLADDPRVGKTGTLIMACDYVYARRILVITTASGRPVWRAGFEEWQAFPRSIEVLYKAPTNSTGSSVLPKADVVITSWSLVAKQPVFRSLCQLGKWDVLILDESHYAGDPATKRTIAVYGVAGDPEFWALADISKRVWCASGSPIPKTPNSLHPMLRKLAPELLKARRGASWEWPDVTAYDAFLHRYCVVKREFRAGQWVEIIQHAQRTEELGARLDGFFRRLKQSDVGITEPVYELLPLHVEMTAFRQKRLFGDFDEQAILAAAETGTTDQLEMHLAPLRRLTGRLKAMAVVELLREEFANGLDKVVLFCWHTDVGRLLEEELKEFGADYIDGEASPAYREFAVNAFRTDPAARVLVGQMAAMGEAVDLSVANETIMVELDSVPMRMRQAALRITNLTQKRLPRVRVAALEGSIDEPLAKILTRRVADIKTIMEPTK